MAGELFEKLYTYQRQLVGGGAVLVLFFAALLLFVSEGKKCAPLILSPLGAVAVAVSETLGRFFCKRQSRPYGIAAGIFSVCLIAVAIALSGGDVTFGEMAEPVSNEMHIPGDLADAMSAILDESDDPHVLTMPGWGVYFTAYSSAFDMMYDDPHGGDLSGLDENAWAAYTQLSVLHPDMKTVSAAARRSGCDYVVLSNDIWPEMPITRFGYEPVYKGDLCTAYREVDKP